jgi:hypothetical protein
MTSVWLPNCLRMPMSRTTAHGGFRSYIYDGNNAAREFRPTARSSRWLRSQAAVLWAIAAVLVFFRTAANAADLKPETLQAWDEYVKTVNAEMKGRLGPDRLFLQVDEAPDRCSKLRSGEIMVSPAGPHIPKRVPSGLIHDWVGAAFIPGATLQDVLPVVRDYGHYKEMYHPGVIESKPIATSDSEDRFSMVLMNKSVVAKTAVEGDYLTSYFSVNDHRWYSVSETTRIQEIAGYGTAGQHTLPQGKGTGFIWRIGSITRFEERDGGVYVELEALVLSRDIPASLRLFVEPIVRRVSRESLETSVHQTQEAVRTAARLSDRKATSGPCTGGNHCAAAAPGAEPQHSLR